MPAQVEKGVTPPDDLVEALTKALHSERPALRDSAEDALRRIGKGASAAIPGLIKELADSTPKSEAGFGPTAALTLGDIAPGTERAGEAIAALTSALDAKDQGTRMAAAQGLGRFGPAAVAALKLRNKRVVFYAHKVCQLPLRQPSLLAQLPEPLSGCSAQILNFWIVSTQRVVRLRHHFLQ